MNWILRLNSIQHGETYQGQGAGECGLEKSHDRVEGYAWPPEADGVIFRLIPRIGETQLCSVCVGGCTHRTRKRERGGSKVGPYVLYVLGGPRNTMPRTGRCEPGRAC